MCDVGAIGLGIQGAGLVSNLISSKKEQAAYSNYQAQSTQATLTNYIQQVKAINNRYAEEQEASALEKQQISIENMQAKATAQASAASGGVEGSTIENLFRGYDRATAINNYISARNLQVKGLQYTDELESMRYKAISAINIQQQYTGASTASTLLSGVGGLFTSYANYDYRRSQSAFYKQNTKGVTL